MPFFFQEGQPLRAGGFDGSNGRSLGIGDVVIPEKESTVQIMPDVGRLEITASEIAEYLGRNRCKKSIRKRTF